MSWLDEFLKAIRSNPLFMFDQSGGIQAVETATNNTNVNNILSNAQSDPTAAQGELAQSGYNMTSEQEKYLDNLIAQQQTNSARDWEQQMRDTDYLSVGKQLEQLGLNASGVLSTGASHNGVAAADTIKSNIAQQKYEQRMAMARQLLSMTAQMASAGIYGNAIGAARKASSVLTSAASHSAYDAINDNAALYRSSAYHFKSHSPEAVDNWGIPED